MSDAAEKCRLAKLARAKHHAAVVLTSKFSRIKKRQTGCDELQDGQARGANEKVGSPELCVETSDGLPGVPSKSSFFQRWAVALFEPPSKVRSPPASPRPQLAKEACDATVGRAASIYREELLPKFAKAHANDQRSM